MKYLIITGNPKQDGLCHAVTAEIAKGAAEGGAEVEVRSVNGMGACRCCGDGWGTCLEKKSCSFGEDGFAEAQEAAKSADLICLVTPVYWGEAAEGLKSFMDRFRRSESVVKPGGTLSGKPVLLVASPGGSGNGALSCFEQMDRFCRHTGAVIFDYINVNRWNSDYKKRAAHAAALAMAQGRKAGETV